MALALAAASMPTPPAMGELEISTLKLLTAWCCVFLPDLLISSVQPSSAPLSRPMPLATAGGENTAQQQ